MVRYDARAGGVLRVIMPDAAAASGHFIEVVPPRRIASTGAGRETGFRSAKILDCHHSARASRFDD
jgi:hypothetical protein